MACQCASIKARCLGCGWAHWLGCNLSRPMCGAELTPEEKANRLAKCYYPYHAALAELQSRVMPQFILSLHSYTDNYEGKVRYACCSLTTRGKQC